MPERNMPMSQELIVFKFNYRQLCRNCNNSLDIYVLRAFLTIAPSLAAFQTLPLITNKLLLLNNFNRMEEHASWVT